VSIELKNRTKIITDGSARAHGEWLRTVTWSVHGIADFSERAARIPVKFDAARCVENRRIVSPDISQVVQQTGQCLE
jgi:hypothetical protein